MAVVSCRVLAALLIATPCLAMGLQVQPSPASCHVQTHQTQAAGAARGDGPPPAAARQRLPDSQAVAGTRDILWAWLGTPTRRYPHGALGATVHAGSLHVQVAVAGGATQELVYELPLNRVFEDRVPRLVDMDGDGRDEIILVESDALKGSALVVLAVRPVASNARSSGQGALTLVEVARGPFTGSTFRWLNPVGVADFDGDGQLDIASVSTPHIGGTLTLYAYRPPLLVPFASTMDVSNHRMGELEQQLAVIVQLPGQRPTVVLPDMSLTALHAFRWEAPGQWKELADQKPLPARAQRLTPTASGGCLQLADGSFWRMVLTP